VSTTKLVKLLVKDFIKMSPKPAITLVIPCRNEAGTIGLAIEKGAKLPAVKEIIVVEGNSTDKTHQIAKQYLNQIDSTVSCSLFKQRNKGKWDAVTLGIKKSSHDFISIWDADLTVSPEEQKMIHEIFLDSIQVDDNVFATGNRMSNREPGAMRFFNVLGNYFFGYLWNYTARGQINDSLCGSKIFKKSNLDFLPQEIKNLDPYGDFSIIASEILSNSRTISVPVIYRARTYGQTNIARWRGGLELLRIWCKLHRFIRKQNI
jgi:glycosyltransferase involved in cell wall biosynthesis